jgi:hypothetical protein
VAAHWLTAYSAGWVAGYEFVQIVPSPPRRVHVNSQRVVSIRTLGVSVPYCGSLITEKYSTVQYMFVCIVFTVQVHTQVLGQYGKFVPTH